MSTKKGTSSKKQKVKQKTAAQVVGSRAAGMKSAARRSPKGGSVKKKKAKAKVTSGKPSKKSRTMKSAATEPKPAKIAGASAALKSSAARRRSSSKRSKKGKGTASKRGKAAESDSKEAEASDETPYNGKYIEKPEGGEDEKYGGEEKCEGRDESWFPATNNLITFTEWATAEKFEEKAIGENKRELDDFLMEYVYSRTDHGYDPHMPTLEFCRRLWVSFRKTEGMSLADCFCTWRQILKDQHIYWERLKHLSKQPLDDWLQTKLDIDELLSSYKLHMAHVFLQFPTKQLSEGLYKVLRYIIFTSDNGYSMWCKSPSGELMSAHDYAIRTGAETLQCLMAEYFRDRCQETPASVKAVVKRQLEEGLRADKLLSLMETDAERSAAVRNVVSLWEQKELVHNLTFQLGQRIQPKIGEELVKLSKEGHIDSDFLLRQLHTAETSIIDWQLFKEVLEVIEKNQGKATTALKKELEVKLRAAEEMTAFAALCAVQNEQKREAHSVHMWHGTDASESAMPMMSEAASDSAAVEAISDSGMRITADHGAYASIKKMHSRRIYPNLRQAIKKIFQKEVLRLATLSFAEPKSVERSNQKAVEYVLLRRRYPSFACILDLLRFSATCDSYDELLKVFHAFVQLFAAGVLKEGGVSIVLVRIKNTFDAAKLGRFGDIKVNVGISMLMPDGSYYTTTCECSFNLTQAQVCHKRLHVEYELMRQRDFYQTVSASKVTVDTIFSSADIDAMFPRVDFCNPFFGGSEALPGNCRRFLQLAGFSLKHAKQLVALLPATGRNPLHGDGVAVCNLVFNHSKDLEEWLKLLKDPKLFGAEDESWKKLMNKMKETPLVVYFSTGECDMAVIRKLNVSKSTFHKGELCGKCGVSVVHYLAMHATPDRIEQFDAVFPSVRQSFLSAKCFMGPPLAAYLNAAGQNANVELARAFLPADRSGDAFKELLYYVDVSEKALEIIKALFTPVQFKKMKGKYSSDGLLPVVLFVARATTDRKDARFGDMVRALVHTQVFTLSAPRHWLRDVADVFTPDKLVSDFLGFTKWNMFS